MLTTGSLALLTCLCLGQPGEPVKIPIIGQPDPFYGAAGSTVTIMPSAEPAELEPNQAIRYRLVIDGIINPSDVTQPDLGMIAAFQESFTCKTISSAIANQQLAWEYELIPRSRQVQAIPVFTLPYYDPKRPQPEDFPSFPFRTVQAKAIPIQVREPVTPAPPIVEQPLDIPAHVRNPVGKTWFPQETWVWVVWLVLPSSIVALHIAWQYARRPDSYRKKRMQQYKATRQAIQQLERHNLTAHEILATLRTYLSQRLQCDTSSMTSKEIVQVIAERTPHLSDRWGDFLQRLDEARFGPATNHSQPTWCQQAVQLIISWEQELSQ
ncbi:MAG: hypothetical protein R3B84_23300 [Zavarzinella sp.]